MPISTNCTGKLSANFARLALPRLSLHNVLRVAGNLQTIAVYHSAEVIKVVVCGRFMEAVANADTIVFDKTGTLTYATPRVAMIETFGDREESEISLPT